MTTLTFLVSSFTLWQLCASRSLLPQDNLYVAPLSSKEEERIRLWTEDDKQNIWELSGQYEGDIILTPKQRNGLIDNYYRWHNREIPYEIDPGFISSERSAILHALDEYTKKTCITPRPKEASDVDYVYITGQYSGCFSSVGRQGGKQDINLQFGSSCLKLGTVLHEFLHALGFYHQQSASDRNNYVDIIWSNVQSGKEHNFKKYSDTVVSNFGEEYDYNSVLHYSAYAFSENGDKTIIPKDASAEIGQRKGFSPTDIAKLNKMYGC